MQRNQKILVTVLWGMTVLAMVAVVGTGLWARRQGAAGTGPEEEMPHLAPLWEVPAFSLTDQNGKTITDQSLRGNVWTAMVFFTECPGVCPMMAARMAQLQKAVTLPDVKIVSFSIDPEHDTPEKLKEYAGRFEADQSRWHMLTGQKQTMFDIASALKLAAKPAENGNPITHTQKVLLVDRANRVRGSYDTNDNDSMKQLAEDIRKLAATDTATAGSAQ
jgi:protein SCO1